MNPFAIPFLLAEVLLAVDVVVWSFKDWPAWLAAPGFVALMWFTWTLARWAGR